MRAILLITLSVLMLGCSSTTTSTRSDDINQADIRQFRKTFEGTLVDKALDEFDRKVPIWGIPFWTRVESGAYLQLTIMSPDGKVRKFYDYSEDERRMSVLRQYYRELAKGDLIVVDLGFVDEDLVDEPFEAVAVRSL
jgi:hypothetical protein